MKLIKAYIRTNRIDKVIHALEAGGFTDMTAIDVKTILGAAMETCPAFVRVHATTGHSLSSHRAQL
jgi:nitrogen regulatory protein PII